MNLNLLYLLLMQHFAKIGTYGIPHLGACESVAGFYLNIMGYRKVTRDYCLAQNMQISTRIHPRTCNILRKGQHISESRLRCYLPSFEVEKNTKVIHQGTFKTPSLLPSTKPQGSRESSKCKILRPNSPLPHVDTAPLGGNGFERTDTGDSQPR